MTVLFNKIIENGKMPLEWKTRVFCLVANVVMSTMHYRLPEKISTAINAFTTGRLSDWTFKNTSSAILCHSCFKVTIQHQIKTKHHNSSVYKNRTWIIQYGDRSCDVAANYKSLWCYMRFERLLMNLKSWLCRKYTLCKI